MSLQGDVLGWQQRCKRTLSTVLCQSHDPGSELHFYTPSTYHTAPLNNSQADVLIGQNVTMSCKIETACPAHPRVNWLRMHLQTQQWPYKFHVSVQVSVSTMLKSPNLHKAHGQTLLLVSTLAITGEGPARWFWCGSFRPNVHCPPN